MAFLNLIFVEIEINLCLRHSLFENLKLCYERNSHYGIEDACSMLRLLESYKPEGETASTLHSHCILTVMLDSSQSIYNQWVHTRRVYQTIESIQLSI